MSDNSAYRRILSTTTLISGATIATILIGAVRIKFVALELGPAGIGLLGLLSTMITLGVAVAAFGLNATAVRELAPALRSNGRTARVLLAILLVTAGGALLGLIGPLLLKAPLSFWVTNNEVPQAAIAWLGIGIAAGVISTTAAALLQAYRHIVQLAIAQIAAAVIGTILAILAVRHYEQNALVIVALLPNLCMLLSTLVFVIRIPRPRLRGIPMKRAKPSLQRLVSLGSAVMVAAILGSVSQLLTRALVVREFGLEGSGHFQAALTLSSLNFTLILSALGTDFFPRVSAVANDRMATKLAFDQQMRATLLILGPALAGMQLVAGVALNIFYSREFGEAAGLLRWMLVGDAIRSLGYMIGYCLLAQRDSKAHIWIEATYLVVFAPALILLLPLFGLLATALAYVIAYAACLLVAFFSLRIRHKAQLGFSSMQGTLLLAATLGAAAFLIEIDTRVGIAAAALITLGWTARSLLEFRRMGFAGNLNQFVRRKLAR